MNRVAQQCDWYRTRTAGAKSPSSKYSPQHTSAYRTQYTIQKKYKTQHKWIQLSTHKCIQEYRNRVNTAFNTQVHTTPSIRELCSQNPFSHLVAGGRGGDKHRNLKRPEDTAGRLGHRYLVLKMAVTLLNGERAMKCPRIPCAAQI